MPLRLSKLLVAAIAFALLGLAIPSAASAAHGGVCFECEPEKPDEPGPEAEDTPTPAPSQYTRRDLRQLTREIGFRKPKVAAAIALAESSGDPLAKGENRKPRSTDRGLFQINDRWHPEVTDRCAYDARCNAEAAYEISNGGRDWTPWSTWHNGAYEQFL